MPLDKEALRKKYAEERAKRIREDGNEQYLEIKGQLAHYLDDPYTPFVERRPKHDHVTFAFIGGGFAGLVVGAKLKQAGIDDVRIIEKGGDFGGTWYWNRYPGAQCDTASMIYMPLLEEVGHMPTEKYVYGPEILEHSRNIGRTFGLYDNALFHTQVTDLAWSEKDRHWEIETNRGDKFTAQFVGMGTGPLHVPKLPGIPGIEDFEGHSFHTSRWDYEYTGGDADGAPLDNLADKRVAIIGTGATAVQCVPHLARAAGKLYVLQRTPSSVDVRDNRPIDADWFGDVATPGWQEHWYENFVGNQSPTPPPDDLVDDGWTEISRRIRSKVAGMPQDNMTPETVLAAFEDADFEKMEEIRARVDAVVNDPDAAHNLKAWYRQLCKRPCFHDEYLQAFNNPNVELVDTDGQGVERITANGLVVDGREYEVDCIIYASGFEVGTEYKRRAGFDLKGREGEKLSDHWSDGMRTKHGVHVHGFPNAFIVQPTQGANLISNIPHNIVDSAKTIAQVVAHARAIGAAEVEVTKEAEDAWVELLLTGMGMVLGSQDCTPGYYNNEGQKPGPAARLNVGYPSGAKAYFEYIEAWRQSGDYEGLTFNTNTPQPHRDEVLNENPA